MLPALWTRNPIYLALVLVLVGGTYLGLSLDPSSEASRIGAAGWRPLLRLGILLAFLTALVPPLLVHNGETPLIALPSVALPLPGLPEGVAAPRLGGPVTLESIAYGVSTALGLVALLLAFATFNIAAEAYALLRALPRALARSGVVLSIAVTFVPQMMEAQKEIREAQALRGHRFRGLRDLAPLFVVLLAEGLERSITLAESLEARGFSAELGPRRGRGALLFAFVLLVAGAALRVWAPQGWGRLAGFPWGDVPLLLGVATLVAALARLGRTSQRTRLRRSVWRPRDWVVALAAGGSILLVVSAHFVGGNEVDSSGLGWYPYPRITVPETHPLGLAALALLAVPLLWTRLEARRSAP